MWNRYIFFGLAIFLIPQSTKVKAEDFYGTVGYWEVYAMPNSCRLSTGGPMATFSVFYPYVNGNNTVQFLLTHKDWNSLEPGGEELNISVNHGPTRLSGSWIETYDNGFFYGYVPFEGFLNSVRRYPNFTLEFFVNSRKIFETDVDPQFPQGLQMLRDCRLSRLGVEPKDPFADPNSGR